MREVGWPPKVESYMKWRRPCREVLQNPLRLHIFFGELLLGGSNVEK